MLQTKEIVTAVGTLACAVGIGFIMQSGDTAEQRYGAVEDSKISGPDETENNEFVSMVTDSDVFLEVEEIKLTSSQTETPIIELPREDEVQLASVATSALESPVPDVAVPAVQCEITAQSLPVNAAMIDLVLNAPCLPNERVTVHHRGMMFTETTSAEGTLNTTIPALDENALVIFAFSNGDGAVTQVQVPELNQYTRTAVQWKVDAGFEMHAREFGADYGDAGHVWKDAARGPDAVNDAQGFMTRLGDSSIAESLLAEVYTFPIAATAQEGLVDLSIEAEVTAMNCGQEIEAQSFEVLDGDVKTNDLTLAVPDCDAKGSFLVLNNLVEDLKVASN